MEEFSSMETPPHAIVSNRYPIDEGSEVRREVRSATKEVLSVSRSFSCRHPRLEAIGAIAPEATSKLPGDFSRISIDGGGSRQIFVEMRVLGRAESTQGPRSFRISRWFRDPLDSPRTEDFLCERTQLCVLNFSELMLSKEHVGGCRTFYQSTTGICLEYLAICSGQRSRFRSTEELNYLDSWVLRCSKRELRGLLRNGRILHLYISFVYVKDIQKWKRKKVLVIRMKG